MSGSPDDRWKRRVIGRSSSLGSSSPPVSCSRRRCFCSSTARRRQASCVLFLLAQIPLASVIVLSRTGDLRIARSLSIGGWLAMATAIHALTPGYDAFSIALLLVALIEAALTPDVGAVIVIEVVAIAALALTAGSQSAGAARTADGTCDDDHPSRSAAVSLYRRSRLRRRPGRAGSRPRRSAQRPRPHAPDRRRRRHPAAPRSRRLRQRGPGRRAPRL